MVSATFSAVGRPLHENPTPRTVDRSACLGSPHCRREVCGAVFVGERSFGLGSAGPFCVYAQPVSGTVGQRVEAWRMQTGLSQNALAKRVGVPASTVRRIERGESDPTVTMLRRIASAAGQHLEILSYPHAQTAPSLARLVQRIGSESPIRWTPIRAFADWLDLNLDLLPCPIIDPPQRTNDHRFDNLVAAIAERISDVTGDERPRWTSTVKPLAKPWYTEGTPMMQERNALLSPSQFRKRNIWFGANAVWHDGSPMS